MGTGINLPPPPPLQFLQTGNGQVDAANQRVAHQWADWFFKLQALAQAIGWDITVTAPAEITVTGSPVGADGTLALSWANQSANRAFMGPTSGADATPVFRLLVANDYPTMIGDSGSGGVKGAVPAPSAGDAASLKALFADGTWKTASASNPWPVIKETVDLTETCTIPSGYQLLIDENFDITGTLNVEGELHVLDAGPLDSYWPIIKNKVDTQEFVTVPTDFQMIVMEEFTIIGDINLDGELFVQI